MIDWQTMSLALRNDAFKFIAAFFVLVLVRYYIPSILGNMFFWALIPCLFFVKLNKMYFWLALFLLVLNSPGYLLHAMTNFCLPQINLPFFGRDVRYSEIMTVALLVYALIYGRRSHVFYHTSIWLIIIYTIFLLLQGLLFGSSLIGVLKSTRYLFPIFLFVAIPKIMTKESLYSLMNLLFVSILILFISQLFDRFTGSPIASYLGDMRMTKRGDEYSMMNIFVTSTGYSRSVYGVYTLLITLTMSLSMLIKGRSPFSRFYLSVIVFVSVFGLILSASRGWTVAAAFLLGFSAFYFRSTIFKTVSYLGIMTIILFSIPFVRNQVFRSYGRIMTVQLLLEGDLTAGGTLARITEYTPAVMAKFYESPVIGFGFSPEYYQYANDHVGIPTLLLNGGVVGFIFYIVFLLGAIIHIISVIRAKKKTYLYPCMFGIISFILVGTSTTVFLYSFPVDEALSLSIFFYLIHILSVQDDESRMSTDTNQLLKV